jgi:hypothetical protein
MTTADVAHSTAVAILEHVVGHVAHDDVIEFCEFRRFVGDRFVIGAPPRCAICVVVAYFRLFGFAGPAPGRGAACPGAGLFSLVMFDWNVEVIECTRRTETVLLRLDVVRLGSGAVRLS